ncbi:hypothetical protein HPYSS1_05476, partial [Helicobacter pylori SS1]
FLACLILIAYGFCLLCLIFYFVYSYALMFGFLLFN